MNVEQLLEALGVKEADLSPCGSEFEMQGVYVYVEGGGAWKRVGIWDLSGHF